MAAAVLSCNIIAYAETKKAELRPSENIHPAAKETAFYDYSAGNRRDPFMPLIVKEEEKKPVKGLRPIERYAASEFKLIGVLWENTKYYAAITLPDGKSYTITEGMKLGLHAGKVHKITKDSVIIREHVKDHKGRLSPRDTILKLRMEGK
jgi:Tfp pilus assembly protein PilP